MTSSGNNSNYFLQNQLTQFSACSSNNKSKQVRQKKFKVEVLIICERSKQKKFLTVLYAELSH